MRYTILLRLLFAGIWVNERGSTRYALHNRENVSNEIDRFQRDTANSGNQANKENQAKAAKVFHIDLCNERRSTFTCQFKFQARRKVELLVWNLIPAHSLHNVHSLAAR